MKMKTAQAAVASGAPPMAAMQSESLVGPSRILVVDDNAGVRCILEKVLVHAGYRVSTAEDGERGWDAFNRGHFDLLITDHDMPRLTGLDLTRRVRARRRDLPVIIISGKMPWVEMDLLALLPPGVALEKPISFAELVTHIQSLLASPRNNEPGEKKSKKPNRRSLAAA